MVCSNTLFSFYGMDTWNDSKGCRKHPICWATLIHFIWQKKTHNRDKFWLFDFDFKTSELPAHTACSLHPSSSPPAGDWREQKCNEHDGGQNRDRHEEVWADDLGSSGPSCPRQRPRGEQDKQWDRQRWRGRMMRNHFQKQTFSSI